MNTNPLFWHNHNRRTWIDFENPILILFLFFYIKRISYLQTIFPPYAYSILVYLAYYHYQYTHHNIACYFCQAGFALTIT